MIFIKHQNSRINLKYSKYWQPLVSKDRFPGNMRSWKKPWISQFKTIRLEKCTLLFAAIYDI